MVEESSKFIKLLKNRKDLKSIKDIIIKKNVIKIKNRLLILKLIENLKISFDANEVMYINKINIPPIKIRKREYENQKVFVKIPENKAINIV